MSAHLVLQFLCAHTLHADVYNKIDAISLEQMDKLARSDHAVVISCEMNLKYVLQLLLD